MACLQNGTTLLNNNNLSSFKHNIMKYDETHANVYTSQINNFLSNQIPFRNNHTKDKTQSDNNVFNDEHEHEEIIMESCANTTTVTTTNTHASTTSDEEEEEDDDGDLEEEEEEIKTIVNNNKTTKEYQFFTKTTISNDNEIVNDKSDTNININNTNRNCGDIYNYMNDDSYQKELSDNNNKGSPVVTTVINNEPTESGEPSHHARRPMNAFLIFCKRHRTIVKNRYPHLENRAVTKILGEWWAGLEPEDKACYTELAKQYKNAFFSANPNFKWYKLPAPPLRTLNTRPGNIVKSPPPPKDLQDIEEQLPHQQQQQQQQPQPQPQQLFTPGKLADETQLGSITSLINSNNQHGGGGITTNTITNSNSNKTPIKNDVISEDEQPQTPDNYKNFLLSPPNTNMITTMCRQPAKPFKKRLVLSPTTTTNKETSADTKNIVRSIFTKTQQNETDTGITGIHNNKTDIFDSSLLQQALQSFVCDEAFDGDFTGHLDSNLTQQELINKVVDHMCSSSTSKTDSNDSHSHHDADDLDDECNTCMMQNQEQEQDQDQEDGKETRKSVRSCKGLLYAKFMAEGKLFVSKRNRNKSLSNATTTSKMSFVAATSSTVSDKVPRNTEPIELSDTIKKLAERTIGSVTLPTITTASSTTTITTPYNYTKTMDHDSTSSSSQMQTQQYEMSQEREEKMKMFRAADFNLDEKIEALPSLSLDKFQQKKKENKKRKFLRATTKMKDTNNERKKISNNTTAAAANVRSDLMNDKNAVNLIGSRKRKPIGKPRKQNNNNNNNNNDNSSNNNNNNNNNDTSEIDLFGLATLAEVAAKKAKIDQK